MHNRFLSLIVSLLSFFLLLLSGCGSSGGELSQALYQDMHFFSAEADIKAALGAPVETYPSFYGGNTLTYDHTFMEHPGIVKYMLDEEGLLVSIAWMGQYPSSEDCTAVYNDIHDRLSSIYGNGTGANNDKSVQGISWDISGLNELSYIKKHGSIKCVCTLNAASIGDEHIVQLSYICSDSSSASLDFSRLSSIYMSS